MEVIPNSEVADSTPEPSPPLAPQTPMELQEPPDAQALDVQAVDTAGLLDVTTPVFTPPPALLPPPLFVTSNFHPQLDTSPSRRDPTPPRSYLPPQRLTEKPSQGSWGWSLLVCLLLGSAIGWAVTERKARQFAEQHTEHWRQELDLTSGRQMDVGQLLADPQTRVFHLHAPQDSNATPAAVAWNADRQQGWLFCQELSPLPSKDQYELWFVNDGHATLVVSFAPEPGRTAYDFHPDMHGSVPAEVVLTAGPPTEKFADAARVLLKG